MYKVYAVINNCTDRTKQRALEYGAEIIECEGKISCKGDVLKYAFNRLRSTDTDAFIIFDADNVVHPDFLSAMNNVYASGHYVAQGRKDTKNMGDNWISASYSLFYNLQNFFYNRSRTHIGAAATINGTGFMVAKHLVEDGFEPHTVTEDIELALVLPINEARTQAGAASDHLPELGLTHHLFEEYLSFTILRLLSHVQLQLHLQVVPLR